jgi:hypothetical protein
MTAPAVHSWVRTRGPLYVLTVVAALIVRLAVDRLDLESLFPDVICYWSAAELLADGRSPYDVTRQRQVQADYGWQRESNGLGKYDFLPYYYPPWFGMLFVPLRPLGFGAAKIAWFFLNVEMALAAGYLLRPTGTGAPCLGSVLLAALSLFTLASVVLGQTAVLVLFLAALSWRLLETGRDRAAGVALAWLTVKPQLTAVVLLALALRLAGDRRWRVAGWFVATLGVLGLVSTLVLPTWLTEMLGAPRQTPSPTEYFPWIGNAWYLVLRTGGVGGMWLLVLYLAAALPLVAATVRASLRREYSLLDLMGLGLLAAFFVAPYARHYDFAVLAITVLALARHRLSPLAGKLLPVGFVILPYVQQFILAEYKRLNDPGGLFVLEGTYFWIPAVLAVLWVTSARRRRDQVGAARRADSSESL